MTDEEINVLLYVALLIRLVPRHLPRWGRLLEIPPHSLGWRLLLILAFDNVYSAFFDRDEGAVADYLVGDGVLEFAGELCVLKGVFTALDADRKSTRLNSSHKRLSRMPSSA